MNHIQISMENGKMIKISFHGDNFIDHCFNCSFSKTVWDFNKNSKFSLSKSFFIFMCNKINGKVHSEYLIKFQFSRNNSGRTISRW